MNDEKQLQIEQIFKLFVVVLCASLYAWAGMENKWLRRFLAPSIAGATCLMISRDWKSLIKMPLLIASSCLGYGADVLWLKIVKRFYVGLAFSVGAFSYDLVLFFEKKDKKKFFIIGLTLILIPAYIILGVFNPLPARIEETLLGLLVYTFVIMPVKRKEIL